MEDSGHRVEDFDRRVLELGRRGASGSMIVIHDYVLNPS